MRSYFLHFLTKTYPERKNGILFLSLGVLFLFGDMVFYGYQPKMMEIADTVEYNYWSGRGKGIKFNINGQEYLSNCPNIDKRQQICTPELSDHDFFGKDIQYLQTSLYQSIPFDGREMRGVIVSGTLTDKSDGSVYPIQLNREELSAREWQLKKQLWIHRGFVFFLFFYLVGSSVLYMILYNKSQTFQKMAKQNFTKYDFYEELKEQLPMIVLTWVGFGVFFRFIY